MLGERKKKNGRNLRPQTSAHEISSRNRYGKIRYRHISNGLSERSNTSYGATLTYRQSSRATPLAFCLRFISLFVSSLRFIFISLLHFHPCAPFSSFCFKSPLSVSFNFSQLHWIFSLLFIFLNSILAFRAHRILPGLLHQESWPNTQRPKEGASM